MTRFTEALVKTTSQLERICKIVFIFLFSFYMTLVTLNNLTDYNSNFEFVKHVLLMDSTFKDNQLLWRSLSSPSIHTTFYIGLILFEFIISVLGWIGCFIMIKNFKKKAIVFHNSKRIAIVSLLLSLIMWFCFFIAIGGEWFLMWQSSQWNGLAVARPMFSIVAIILFYITKKDED